MFRRGLLPGVLLACVTIVSTGIAEAAPVKVGESVKGRGIEVRRYGDPAADFKALIVGSIHGDEPEGMRVVHQLNQLARQGIRRVDLWTIRTLNPDGLARGTRKNAHGVDLNRNFGYRFDPTLSNGYESGPGPFSEPESRTIRRLASGRDFDLSIWYHQPWGRTLAPCGDRRRYARVYARLSGLGTGPGCDHDLPGSAINWLHHEFGTIAFVVEFPEGRLPKGQVKRHAKAVVKLMKDMR